MTRFAIVAIALLAFGCSPEKAESEGDEAVTQPVVTEDSPVQSAAKEGVVVRELTAEEIEKIDLMIDLE